MFKYDLKYIQKSQELFRKLISLSLMSRNIDALIGAGYPTISCSLQFD